jgi:hypothetical protein
LVPEQLREFIHGHIASLLDTPSFLEAELLQGLYGPVKPSHTVVIASFVSPETGVSQQVDSQGVARGFGANAIQELLVLPDCLKEGLNSSITQYMTKVVGVAPHLPQSLSGLGMIEPVPTVISVTEVFQGADFSLDLRRVNGSKCCI